LSESETPIRRWAESIKEGTHPTDIEPWDGNIDPDALKGVSDELGLSKPTMVQVGQSPPQFDSGLLVGGLDNNSTDSYKVWISRKAIIADVVSGAPPAFDLNTSDLGNIVMTMLGFSMNHKEYVVPIDVINFAIVHELVHAMQEERFVANGGTPEEFLADYVAYNDTVQGYLENPYEVEANLVAQELSPKYQVALANH
jgi:hypothetical protein